MTTSTTPLRTAVIGVGYLGHFHAEKFAKLEQSNLVAVCDIDPAHAQAHAQALGVKAYADYHDLIPHVDAVSIVTPTPTHFEIAAFFLQHGVHV